MRTAWGIACVPALISWVAFAAPLAAQEDGLAGLRALFETDPASAFEEAARMFED